MISKKKVCFLFLVSAISLFLLTGVSAFDFDELKQIRNTNVSSIESIYVLLLPEKKHSNEWEKDTPSLLVLSHLELQNNDNLENNAAWSLDINGLDNMAQIRGIYETNKGIYQRDYFEANGIIFWFADAEIEQGDNYKLKIEHYNSSGSYDNIYKSFTYKLEPQDTIPELRIDLFLPMGASDYFFSEEASSHKHINSGEVVYSFYYQNISKNNPLILDFKYKESDILYLNYGEVNYDKTNKYNFIPTIIFALVLLILGLAVVLFSQPNKNIKTDYRFLDIENYDKKELIQMLIDGEISEDTYEDIIDDKYR